MAAAVSRHTSQKLTPDTTRAAKYQTSSGIGPLTIDVDPSGRSGDSEGPSQMARLVLETWSHIPVPKWPKSEGRPVQGYTDEGGEIREVGGASRYRQTERLELSRRDPR